MLLAFFKYVWQNILRSWNGAGGAFAIAEGLCALVFVLSKYSTWIKERIPKGMEDRVTAIARWCFVGVFFISVFVIMPFIRYDESRDASQKSERIASNEITRLTKLLSGRITMKIVRSSLLPSPFNEDAWIALKVQGVNNGAPRGILVWSWKLSVRVPNGTPFEFREQPVEFIPDFGTNAPPEYRAIYGDKSKHLPTLLRNPIQTGGGFDGWVMFSSSAVPHWAIPPGSHFVLKCEDADNETITADYSFVGVTMRARP
jgi:hypothetical protein